MSELVQAKVRWTLVEGIVIVQEIEEKLRPMGLFTGLTGSVLYKGYSPKDLDITVMPLNATVPIPLERVHEVLKARGWRIWFTEPQLKVLWGSKGIIDTKFVEVWKTSDDRRVDVMYLK
jgi:hypothetical protein